MNQQKQPRALYLADVLSAGFECDMEWYEIEAARELRRLHDENEALKAKLQVATHSALNHKERGDELLEALKDITDAADEKRVTAEHYEVARAAIAKAGGAA